MNILMFGWELPPLNTGGLGVACAGLTKSLSHQGIHINFILPQPYSHPIDYMHVHSAPLNPKSYILNSNSSFPSPYSTMHHSSVISQSPATRLPRPGKAGYQPPATNHSLIDLALHYGILARHWAQQLPHDIIHTHDWLTFPAGINAAKISNKPLITHLHATEFNRTGGQRGHPQVEAIEAEGLQKADHVITVSHYTKETIKHRYGIPDSKITVVHNGIEAPIGSPTYPTRPTDTALRDILPNYQIILFVGRLTIQKGADYLLKAAAKVLPLMPKTIFIIVGGGDMRHQLIMEAASRGIGNRVLFPGFLRGQHLMDLYQAADVFVMPSVSEPFGLVALEAMQTGKPVIVSRQSGVSEVIKHALKVDFWDTDRLADYIIAILKHSALQKEMAHHARREVNHITWDTAAAKTIGVYQQLLSPQG